MTFNVKNTESTTSVMKVYPNPASDYIQIDRLGSFSAEVFSIEGRLLISDVVGQVGQQIDIRALKPGLYFIRINSKDEAFSAVVCKFIKN